MALITDDRDLVFVKPFNGATVSYGFNTNADAADRAVLGHIAQENLSGVGVFGANRPKPARMTKQKLGASASSSHFVDWQSIASAKAADWKISKQAKAGPVVKTSIYSVLVGAKVNSSVDVCWSMSRRQFERIAANRTALGIREVTQATANKAVIGASKWYGIQEPKGAASRDALGLISVKYVEQSRLDNLPAGWVAASDNTVSDPTRAI